LPATRPGDIASLIPDAEIEATARDGRQVLVHQSEMHFEALKRIEGL